MQYITILLLFCLFLKDITAILQTNCRLTQDKAWSGMDALPHTDHATARVGIGTHPDYVVSQHASAPQFITVLPHFPDVLHTQVLRESSPRQREILQVLQKIAS